MSEIAILDKGDKAVVVVSDQPEYDESGLTRKGMETVIRNGGSVLIHNAGQGGSIGSAHVSRIEDLPTEAQLAKGNSAKETVARDNLMRQRKAIDDQIAGLGQPVAAPLANHPVGPDKIGK